MNDKSLGRDDIAPLLREEVERVRRAGEDQARLLRQELLDGLRGAQETVHATVRELNQTFSHQSRRNAELLNDAIRALETRLDATIARQGADVAALRVELVAEGRRIAEILRTTAHELDAAGERRQRALAEAIGVKFGHVADSGAGLAGLRDDQIAGLQRLDARITEALSQLGVQQVTRLEQVAQSLRALTEALDAARKTQQDAVTSSLEAVRQEAARLSEDSRRLKELEAENARLRRAVADLTLDKVTLSDALKSKR